MASSPPPPPQPVPPVPIGLPNNDGGNNCFANALIQAVLHTHPLLELLLTADVSAVASPGVVGDAAAAASASGLPALPATASATRQVASDTARSQMLALQELFAEAALWVWLCRHQAKHVLLPALGMRLRELLFGSTDNQQEDAPETLDRFFNVLHEGGLDPHLNLRHRSEYSYAEPTDPCAEPYLGVRAGEHLVPPPRVAPTSPPPTPGPPPPTATEDTEVVAGGPALTGSAADEDEDMVAGDVGDADFLPESDAETEAGEPGSMDEFLETDYDALRRELAGADGEEDVAVAAPVPPPTYEWTPLHHLQRFVLDALQRKRIVKEEILMGELRDLPIAALQALVARLQNGADVALLERVHALQAQFGPARDPKEPLLRAALYLTSARGRVIRWVATTGQRCYNTVGWLPNSLPSTKLDNSLQATKHEPVWMLRMANMAAVAQRIRNEFITFEDAFDEMFVTDTNGCEPSRFFSPANLVQDFKSEWCSTNLTDIPKGFALQLLRFGAVRKVSDPVPVSEWLALNRDTHILRAAFDRFPGVRRIQYRLRVVVVHDGGTGGGHYYTLVRDVLDRWWLCNDAKTELLDAPGDLVRLQRWFSLGYLYYYERDGPLPEAPAAGASGGSTAPVDMPALIDRWVKRQTPSVLERFKAVREAITSRVRASTALASATPHTPTARSARVAATASSLIPSASPPPAFAPNTPTPAVVAPMTGITCIPASSLHPAQPSPAAMKNPTTSKPRTMPRIFQHVRSLRP
jgi:hypothetical protein